MIVKRLGEFMIQNFRQNATAYLAAKAGDEASGPWCHLGHSQLVVSFPLAAIIQLVSHAESKRVSMN